MIHAQTCTCSAGLLAAADTAGETSEVLLVVVQESLEVDRPHVDFAYAAEDLGTEVGQEVVHGAVLPEAHAVALEVDHGAG